MTLTLDKRPEQGLYFIWIKQTMCNSLLKTEEIDYSWIKQWTKTFPKTLCLKGLFKTSI